MARSVGVSVGTVGNTVGRARDAKLDWQQAEQLDERELEVRISGLPQPRFCERPLPPMEYIYKDLHKKGVTLQLLHIEYLEGCPEGYKYTQFCEHYHRRPKKRGLVMRQVQRIDTPKSGFIPYIHNVLMWLKRSRFLPPVPYAYLTYLIPQVFGRLQSPPKPPPSGGGGAAKPGICGIGT